MQKEDVTTDLEDTKYSKMLIHIGCSYKMERFNILKLSNIPKFKRAERNSTKKSFFFFSKFHNVIKKL